MLANAVDRELALLALEPARRVLVREHALFPDCVGAWNRAQPVDADKVLSLCWVLGPVAEGGDFFSLKRGWADRSELTLDLVWVKEEEGFERVCCDPEVDAVIVPQGQREQRARAVGLRRKHQAVLPGTRVEAVADR